VGVMSYLSFRAKINAIAVGVHATVCVISAMAGAPVLMVFSFMFVMISWYCASYYIQKDFEKFMTFKAKEDASNALRD
jgi:hypothetical protein